MYPSRSYTQSVAVLAGFIAACGSSSGTPNVQYDAGNHDIIDASYDASSSIVDARIDAPPTPVIDAGADANIDAGSAEALVCSNCHSAATLSTAHAAHISGGSEASSFPCSECHPMFTSASHASGPVVVAFATATGDIASLGGLSPTWNAQTKRCSGVYCHGGGTTVSGGKVISPTWTITDGSQEQCDSCHGNPPVAGGHIQSTKDFCNVCHADAIQGGRIDRASGLHVDGAIDVMPTAQWGTRGHGLDAAPPGHPVNDDFSSCVVCHGPTPPGLPNVLQQTMTCTSCHE